MIYIIVFLNIIGQTIMWYPSGELVNLKGNECDHTYSIEIYQTIKEVNHRISERKPEKVYKYNLKTKELKILEIKGRWEILLPFVEEESTLERH